MFDYNIYHTCSNLFRRCLLSFIVFMSQRVVNIGVGNWLPSLFFFRGESLYITRFDLAHLRFVSNRSYHVIRDVVAEFSHI